jgi:hypothetical protein
MKTINKKAILAMLVAVIMSLGVMGGINGNSQDSNLQQVRSQQISVSCAPHEGAGWYAASVFFAGTASYFYTVGLITGATGVGAPVALANGLLGVICTL